MERIRVPEQDFNPRSREGSDICNSNNLLCKLYISIHAPAKGATEDRVIKYSKDGISIHAPAKGATVTYSGWLTSL